jgi:hypothetical protein
MRVQHSNYRRLLKVLTLALGVGFGTCAYADCDEAFLKANAIFIHATVECGKNYMDSPAGYYALAMSRKCSALGEKNLTAKAMNAMREFDQVARQKGKQSACKWADALEKAVNVEKRGRL